MRDLVILLVNVFVGLVNRVIRLVPSLFRKRCLRAITPVHNEVKVCRIHNRPKAKRVCPSGGNLFRDGDILDLATIYLDELGLNVFRHFGDLADRHRDVVRPDIERRIVAQTHAINLYPAVDGIPYFVVFHRAAGNLVRETVVKSVNRTLRRVVGEFTGFSLCVVGGDSLFTFLFEIDTTRGGL